MKPLPSALLTTFLKTLSKASVPGNFLSPYLITLKQITHVLSLRPAGGNRFSGEADTEAISQFGHGIRPNIKFVASAQFG